jgi:hypothetical protein
MCRRILEEKDFAMNIATIALVVAAIGVNFGWQPSPDDPQAYEVLMQVEPELVDVMAGGREIPIESHVPASVSPIRSIRVVVGTDELPRTMIAAKSIPATKSDRVVRGQEPSPVEHTAKFQGDGSWAGSRYDPNATAPATGSRQYDQRGATIGVEPIRTAQNSPWTVEGAQQSITDAGNSLRNSVSSSVEQVDRQFSQVGQEFADKTENVANEFGNQLQNLTGFGSQATPPAPVASTAGAKSWAPPPLAGPSQSVTPATPAWTSIRSELAPPRLATPPLAGGVRVASNPAAGRTKAGPSFPAPPTTGTSQQRSLLTTNEEEGDWTSPWGTAGTNSSASGDDLSGVGMVPVPPRIRSTPVSETSSHASPPPAISPNDVTPQPDGRYSGLNESTPSPASGADDWANFGRGAKDLFDDPRLAESSQQPPSAPTRDSQDRSFAGDDTIKQPTIGTHTSAMQTQGGDTQSAQATATADDVPWKPLLAVSLALAGSIGANFYLGMSYAETRHRYRALAAKTTHAFEKKAGLAA